MIKQIESKVVNRLRQVTSAIKQDGANRVSIITSTAEREAAVEFAKAAAIRPQIVGQALQKISEDADVATAMFEILETQKMIEGQARIVWLPQKSDLLAQWLAAASPSFGKAAGPSPSACASLGLSRIFRTPIEAAAGCSRNLQVGTVLPGPCGRAPPEGCGDNALRL